MHAIDIKTLYESEVELMDARERDKEDILKTPFGQIKITSWVTTRIESDYAFCQSNKENEERHRKKVRS